MKSKKMKQEEKKRAGYVAPKVVSEKVVLTPILFMSGGIGDWFGGFRDIKEGDDGSY